MDIIEDIDDELDEYFSHFEPITIPRQSPRSRPNYMETLNNVDFKTRFRLSKQTVNYVYILIRKDISTITTRNNAIEPINRLLLTLRFYATGNFQSLVNEFIGVSKSSASRIVQKVSQVIAKMTEKFIKFPADTNQVQQEFFNIAKFPRLIGAIYCTHVPIKSPGAENYKNRKGQFSINVQILVGPNLKIMDIDAKWPGSSQAQTIFDNSMIKQRLMNGEFGNVMIIGDKHYENNLCILTPLPNPTSPAEHLYNESHIRSWNVVEQTYEILKSRFPVLSQKIIINFSRVESIIVSCAILHNIAMDAKEEHLEGNLCQDLNDDEEDEHVSNLKQYNYVRYNMINGYFAALL